MIEDLNFFPSQVGLVSVTNQDLYSTSVLYLSSSEVFYIFYVEGNSPDLVTWANSSTFLSLMVSESRFYRWEKRESAEMPRGLYCFLLLVWYSKLSLKIFEVFSELHRVLRSESKWSSQNTVYYKMIL